MYRSTRTDFLTSLLTGAMLVAAPAFADDATEERVKTALSSDIRSDAEKDRDANRKPVQTLAFFGLKSDMKVLELLPGGGWYTKLLGPTLAADGELHVALGTGRVSERVLTLDGFENVTALDFDPGFERDGEFGTYSLTNDIDFGNGTYDMVLTFRNVHNFTPEARAKINAAAFQALKPGGVYGVVDHTARHMEPKTRENRRRIDPVRVIHETLEAGFELEAFSDLHYRPDDELRYEVGRKSVTGNTDRFTFRFRKPEE
ncbi:MAG: methyltransferase domain-containing protein [Pseudomonadota bacterium]